MMRTWTDTFIALVAVVVSGVAMVIVFFNPFVIGYREVLCQNIVQYEDGSTVCTVRLSNQDQKVRVFIGN